MNVLLLAPRCPWPAFDGGRQRTLALLRALAAQHAVTLSTPVEDGELEPAVAGLGNLVADWLPAPAGAGGPPYPPIHGNRAGRLRELGSELFSARPPRPLRFASTDWADLLAGHGWDRFGAIVCRYPRQAFLVPPHLHDILVVDADDLVHRVEFQRIRMQPHRLWTWPVALEAVRCMVDELRLLRSARHVMVCSENDLRRVGGSNTSVVRNGTTWPDTSRLRDAEPGVMTFIGNFAYDPNREGLTWFADGVLPLVLREMPGARLDVVGYRAIEAGAAFAGRPGLRLVGPVPDTASSFSGAVLSVVPLQRGAGTRIKILDSLACGRPVVSTPAGADGLPAIGEQHGLYRARTPAAMARRVAGILREPAPYLKAAACGRDLVATAYTWEATMGGLARSLTGWIGGAAHSGPGAAGPFDA